MGSKYGKHAGNPDELFWQQAQDRFVIDTFLDDSVGPMGHKVHTRETPTNDDDDEDTI